MILALQAVARNATGDEEVKAAFDSMHKEGKLLPCSLSVAKLLDILEKDEFNSGAHIDYYD